MFINDNNVLIVKHQYETLRIEAWGKDALRVRSTLYPSFTDNDWALTEEVNGSQAHKAINEKLAVITNGRISAQVNPLGVIAFYKDGKFLLREYFRNYEGTLCKESR